MEVTRKNMVDKIIYCEDCGRVIPPSEAALEDFEALGGQPACIACLEKKDPQRRQQLEKIRRTRTDLKLEQIEALKASQPPAQIYPALNAEHVDSPTRTDIREFREQVIAELRSEHRGHDPKSEWKETSIPPVVIRNVKTISSPEVKEALVQPGLPVRTRRALWVILCACLGLALALLVWPERDPRAESKGTPVKAPIGHPGSNGENTLPRADLKRDQMAVVPKDQAAPPAPHPHPHQGGLLPEVESIHRMYGEAPDLPLAINAINRLKLIARVGDAEASSLAKDYMAFYAAIVDARVRQQAREAAQAARRLAEDGQYDLAGTRLREQLGRLPEESGWAQDSGKQCIHAVIAELDTIRKDRLVRHDQAMKQMMATGNLAAVQVEARKLAGHPDEEFRSLGKSYLEEAEKVRLALEKRKEEERSQADRAWHTFLGSYDGAVAAGNYAAAATLCRPKDDSSLFLGGVDKPRSVLEGFESEIRGIQKLQTAALQAAQARAGESFALPRLLGQGPTRLKGTKGSDLVFILKGDNETSFPLERLDLDEIASLIQVNPQSTTTVHAPAFWILAFAQGSWKGLDTCEEMRRRYQKRNQPLPSHWEQRFLFEKRGAARFKLEELMAPLRDAVARGDATLVRSSLAKVREESYRAYMNDEEKAVLERAEEWAGRTSIRIVCFQNGKTPAPDYVGIRTDMISSYPDHAQRTDVDIQEGLKLGAYGGLHRVLLRFDGLRATLGRGRVLKATLEMYQTESPHTEAEGAEAGIFRLKRIWTPEAGTWNYADFRLKKLWLRPGANGGTDVADKPEVALKLDKHKGWRGWDLTEYVQDLIQEDVQNFGLFIRIIKNESTYHVRFYPSEDLGKDPNPDLRPRLIVKYESVEDRPPGGK